MIVYFLFCCLLCFSACRQLTLPEAELKYGPHAPIIERFFCPSTISSGDTLKFYISARDEDKDLAFIDVNVRQFGAGEHSAPYISVRKQDGAFASGYLYMFTPPVILFGETIHVSVAVIDRAGHRSDTVSQKVYFGDKSAPECPPGWEKECEKDLGHISIFLRPFQDQSIFTDRP